MNIEWMIEEILLRSLDATDWLERHFEVQRERLSKRNVLLVLVLLTLMVLYVAAHADIGIVTRQRVRLRSEIREPSGSLRMALMARKPINAFGYASDCFTGECYRRHPAHRPFLHRSSLSPDDWRHDRYGHSHQDGWNPVPSSPRRMLYIQEPILLPTAAQPIRFYHATSFKSLRCLADIIDKDISHHAKIHCGEQVE